MSLSIGIVGLPNVGKSTLFNTLTKKQVEASNYPFCTIEPNVGMVTVPDERLEPLAKMSKSAKVVPTYIEFVDIAGLVKGANAGEGLGNQFLANIRECDAVLEVVRDFENSDIHHVDGKIDPDSDRETIDTELLLADMATMTKALERAEKDAKSNKKEEIRLRDVLRKVKEEMENGITVRNIELDKEDEKLIKQFNFLTAKPIIYVLNISDSKVEVDKAKWQKDTLELNIKLENEIASLSEEEQTEYIKELGLSESGLDKLVKKAYEILGLVSFLTTGPEETRAWTVKAGSSAPIAAGRIHTDIQEGFIRAEVINWQDLLNAGSEAAAREKGLIRTEGKDYIIQDGDVCHFLHSK
ncbi:redox-regulated ATPase YchF [Candidatus Falkowbacteria bacterium]|nr:redox-regulated ATPase YchF [Candidatus Falkowbacteria bacterium]